MMRSSLAVFFAVASFATAAYAAETPVGSATPAAPVPEASTLPITLNSDYRNLVSGYALPLVVVNLSQLEYERVLSPSIGGIAIRGRADYVYVGAFSLLDLGAGAHWTYYLPIGGFKAPNGLFLQPGADFIWWRGTFYGGQSYRAKIFGTDIEPDVYAGFRLATGHLFVSPRAGVGYRIGGAKYVDDTGATAWVTRTRGLHGHFDLMFGLAW